MTIGAIALALSAVLAGLLWRRHVSGWRAYFSPGVTIEEDWAGKTVISVPHRARGRVGTVTRRQALRGKRRIRVTLAVAGGMRPYHDADAPPCITLYFQRKGCDFTANGKQEAFRWFASFATFTPVGDKAFTIEAALDGPWTAVLTSTAHRNRAAFQDAIAHCDRVGIVFGGPGWVADDGLAHGCSGPATVTILDWQVD